MVALGALAALFIVIGLSVAGFAFHSTRPVDAKPAQGGGLLYAGLAILIVGIGLAIPFALIESDHRNAKKDTPGGVDLSANQAKGRSLFAATCATCHTLRATNSTGKVGPNLDVLQPPAALVTNAIQLGRAQGNGNMPALLLTGEDAKNVASFVAAVAGH
jgi:mono/diheme cytochrome c family protein